MSKCRLWEDKDYKTLYPHCTLVEDNGRHAFCFGTDPNCWQRKMIEDVARAFGGGDMRGEEE